MADATRKRAARAVLARYGRTFSEELGIPIERNTPSPLFRLLCYSLVSSARIGHRIALEAARGLSGAGWTTARAMARSTWPQRVRVLDEAGYVRYDERTSTELGDTASLLMEEYGGDLRRLRDRAKRDPKQEHALLQAFSGIGALGADIFLREVQLAWDEVYPFADQRVLEAARQLGLGADARTLARLAGSRRDFVRLVGGVMRIRLAHAFDEIRAAA